MAGRRAAPQGGGQDGQGLVEFAVALPALLLAALAILQFSLYVHAQNVVTTACAEGAIVAAAGNGTAEDGIATARAMLAAGLGDAATGTGVQAAGGGGTVSVEISGSLPILLLGPALRLPLHARSVMVKEG
jgi:Flp pilus assembly protein TadG